ncbi:MAG TPA: ROK family protein [Ktedonobacteraceae bacterium]|nr:ROK family protein [Ktedonobacteraceae bacterium]
MQEKTTSNQQNLPLVVGVDLGGTHIRTAVLRGPKIHSRVSLLTGENPRPERLLPRVYGAIEQALDEAQITLDQIAGIGVATPGPLNNRTGVIYSPPNLPGWDNVPLRDVIRQRFNTTILIENDAHSAGLGEYMFGAGRGSRYMVYLTVSTGIGGGIIIDGKILEGANGTAGELGHMTVDWKGERCNCGNIGCLEYLASGTAIARYANEAIAAGQGADLLAFASTMFEHTMTVPDQAALPFQDANTQPLDEYDEPNTEVEPLRVNSQTVSRAAEAGIPLARDIIIRAAEALGVGLVNIIHIYNPDMIILGGGVMHMGRMLMEPALRIVQERTMKAPRASARIALAQLTRNAGLVGAGALIYTNAQNS